ncbi:MAG TPA: purine-nucleoside phosphorylase [Candidatus Elarobacter sp.]|jgi:purine-nucleoside phosphorylase|nr:purine-nucleoside phosphorylase [Candidatus Elarobacter sp.]
MKRKRVEAAADLLREKAGGDLDCAIVLGSGLGAVMRERIDGTTIAYKKIEGMPQPGVAGHAGEAHIGMLHGRRVVAFSGRFHLYEGRATDEVVYPVVAAAHAGAKTFVLTNAAGGVNPDFRAGDLMLIADQLNLTGTSPLIGTDLLPGQHARFVDMVDAYAPHLRELARHMAAEYAIALREGVYAGLTGPAYETPAEARYARTIGADAVGMSTVLETIAARALERDVVGFSLITNVHGTGLPTSHEEVLAASAAGADHVARMVEGIVANL